ncbi:putative helicase MOV-10 isoform X2 [Malaya genurostris]|uniref:putative helicase MOV-10 isoform X2 n=1 Tax=Malaya genurostris TaxID=325434 RepID=UPI0026F3FD91|nr:putative helicase MOV-10 isoform X2 [Malaya genurostris]
MAEKCSTMHAYSRPKAKVNEILENAIVRCYVEGLLSHEGLLQSEPMFRYFSTDVFNQHRQDVRLREFQALMKRCPLVEQVDADRKQYKIDVKRLIEKIEKKDQCKSADEISSSSSVRESSSLESLISNLQFCSLVREEVHRVTVSVNLTYVSTCKRPSDPSFFIRGRSCIICRLNFPNAMAFHRHLNMHGNEFTMQESSISRKTKSPLLVTLRYDECQLMSTLVVTNLEKCQIKVDCVCLHHERFELFAISTAQTTLQSFDSRGFLVPNSLLVKAHKLYSLFLIFRLANDQLEFIEQYHIKVYEISEQSVGQRSNKLTHSSKNHRRRIRLNELEEYLPPKELCAVVANNFRKSSDYTEIENQYYESVRTSWFNLSLVDNPEQQTAVTNIVNRSSYPLPYILFGPPGTGKTTTLVEAIIQICSKFPTSHVLVTTQSNSACDDITLRLMKYIPQNQLFRFFSRSVEKRIDELPEDLIQCSNFVDGRHRWPSWEDIYRARVLICSLSMCGRLVQACIRTNHFDYVFIDECGSASEPASLVAIAGLVTTKKKLNASVIIAGDPYQLGPVIRSEIADKMGLGISMLERLMNLPVYQKCPNKNVYNQQVITKLVRNFRSHPALIEFANKQFYDSELISVASKDEVLLAENWKWLPNKSFPIILHTVFGNNEQINNSKSLANFKEIETVEFYLEFIMRAGVNGRKISQDEIGIVSPYQLQAQQLRQMCLRKEWPSIEIGSVEQYQGREKLIIILSTVRSHTSGVGFLNNVKRLNVAMTRAKALLIVIGNSYTLQTDPNWYEFIEYCTKYKATVGRCFSLKPSKIVLRSKREAMFDALFNSLV